MAELLAHRLVLPRRHLLEHLELADHVARGSRSRGAAAARPGRARRSIRRVASSTSVQASFSHSSEAWCTVWKSSSSRWALLLGPPSGARAARPCAGSARSRSRPARRGSARTRPGSRASSPSSSGPAYFPHERPLRRRGAGADAGSRAAGAAAAAALARRVRRPGAGARRALGAAARDRGGPGRLGDPLRAARDRQDDARPDRRRDDRRGVRGALRCVGDREGRARGARAGARAARRVGGADDPLPRRDPPLQQGSAGRAAAGGRGRARDADRGDDREPVLRGQLGPALALQIYELRAARRGGAAHDRRAAAPRRWRPRFRPRWSSSWRGAPAATRATR